jgi:hypothetical protein
MEIPGHLHDLVADTLGRDNYAAVDRCAAAERSKRWAVVLGLQPVQDGNMWWLSWGGLPEGVNAFAETPEACIEAFDKAMAAVAKAPTSAKAATCTHGISLDGKTPHEACPYCRALRSVLERDALNGLQSSSDTGANQ